MQKSETLREGTQQGWPGFLILP